ncbi:MAG: hypothetical protein CME06_05035 [Gemmatimonadetes bacterium]|nr:hypothetical protein [Gemmatimonadota bacterium]
MTAPPRGRWVAPVIALLLATLRAIAGPIAPGSAAFEERFESQAAHPISVHTPKEVVLPVEWLIERAQGSFARLVEETGIGVEGGIDVVFAGSDENFRWVTGGLVPEWGTGAALSARRLIVIQYSDQYERQPAELDRVLTHEFAHVLLGSIESNVPRWFDEGHAMFRSQQPDPSMLLTLARAAVFDRLLPLPALADSFPESLASARLAYVESFDAVRSIEEWWGENALRWMLADLVAGSPFDEAMIRTTGHSPAVYSALWRERVRERYGLLDALGGGTLLWALVALVALLGAVGRRIRLKRRRDRMDDDALDGAPAGRSDCGSSGSSRSEPPPTNGRLPRGDEGPEG